MEHFKKAAASTKNFVVDHRGWIGLATGAAAMFALNRHALREHDRFLKEKGLYEEYYTPEDEEVEV